MKSPYKTQLEYELNKVRSQRDLLNQKIKGLLVQINKENKSRMTKKQLNSIKIARKVQNDNKLNK